MEPATLLAAKPALPPELLPPKMFCSALTLFKILPENRRFPPGA